MGSNVAVIAPRDDEDWRSYLRVAERAFGRSLQGVATQRQHGLLRIAVIDGEVIGGMIALPFRQFFGGRPVVSGGLASGCVTPEYRRYGIARRLVESVTDALRQRGSVVVSLWTPSPGVYRGMGWELAGGVHGSRYPIDAFRTLNGGVGQIVRGPEEPAAVTLQRTLAADWNGALERPTWWRDLKEEETERNLSHYGATRNGSLTGLLSYSQEPHTSWGHQLVVEDFWSMDVESTSCFAEFIAEHSTMADEVHFLPGTLPPTNDFSWFLPQHAVEIYSWFPWMIRVIDFPGAIRQRGWPVHIRGRVKLCLETGVKNGSPMALEVEDGEGRLVPGGSDGLAITERAFSTWYAGGLSASEAARIGLMSGDPKSLTLLDQLTAERRCWMPDSF